MYRAGDRGIILAGPGRTRRIGPGIMNRMRGLLGKRTRSLPSRIMLAIFLSTVLAVTWVSVSAAECLPAGPER